MSYYTLITKKGARALVSASSNGDKMNLTHIAVGDANGSAYEPTEAATSLRNEVWRGEISSIAPHEDDAAWLVIEAVIGQADGGFSVREVGVFDDDGNLFAIGKFPETYKPQVSDGVGKELLLRVILQVSNAESINLTLSGRAVATHKFVVDKVLEHNTDSRAHADLLPDASTENKGKVELATDSETVNKYDRNRAVTPAGLKRALPYLVPSASTSTKGRVELATPLETTTGTDTKRAVTPAGLKSALPTLVPDASALTKGRVALATAYEIRNGADNVRAVTPAGLSYALDTLVPDAGTETKGRVELATPLETTTGTDAVRAVTPAGLKSALPTLVPDAGTETKGKVELATLSETTTGTDAVRAVTPAGLKSAVPTLVPDAGTETKGKVELATSSETTAGTDAVRAVTPAGLKSTLAGKEYIRLGPVQHKSLYDRRPVSLSGYQMIRSDLELLEAYSGWNTFYDWDNYENRSVRLHQYEWPSAWGWDRNANYKESTAFYHPSSATKKTIIVDRACLLWAKNNGHSYVRELRYSYRAILA